MTEPTLYKATFTLGGQTITLDVGLTPAAPVPDTGSVKKTIGEFVDQGAYVYRGVPGQPGGTGDPWDAASHFELEKKLGVALDPVSSFLDWSVTFGQVPYDQYGMRRQLISWHPTGTTGDAILKGVRDEWLAQWAREAQAHTVRHGDVYVRLMPEMNGSWSSWSAVNGALGIKSAGDYVKVWRKIVNTVRGAGGTGIKWVFCPNITDDPAKVGIRLEDYYPGSAYVDVLGFDGYNWGDSEGNKHRWASFENLIDSPQGSAAHSIYDRLAALHPSAPVWVCETGSKEPAADDGRDANLASVAGLSPADPSQSKGRWLADALTLDAGRWPRLTCVVWFSVQKERDWRLDSSPEVVAAFRAFAIG